MRGALPRAAERHRPRRGFRLGDDVGDRLEFGVSRHHHKKRNGDDVGNPVEALHRLERQRLEHRTVYRMAGRRDEKRISVRCAAGDFGRANGAGGARLVLDDDGLAEVLRHCLTNDARRRVHAAARRETDHDPDRFRRKVLRLCWPAEHRGQGNKSESRKSKNRRSRTCRSPRHLHSPPRTDVRASLLVCFKFAWLRDMRIS